MDLSDLLDPDRIRCQCNVQSKKRTLQTLAELLSESLRAKQAADDPDTGPESNTLHNGNAKSSSLKDRLSRQPSGTPDNDQPPLTDMQILDALISRERLGSTGLGHGVGLPHSRLNTIQEPIAAFMTLETGVDYDSADGEPVDLVLGLLVPEDCNDEHLNILAQLARRFSDQSLRESLRQFDNAHNLYDHLVSLPTTDH